MYAMMPMILKYSSLFVRYTTEKTTIKTIDIIIMIIIIILIFIPRPYPKNVIHRRLLHGKKTEVEKYRAWALTH